MSFKYGVDWDWEQSLRKEEIKEAIKCKVKEHHSLFLVFFLLLGFGATLNLAFLLLAKKALLNLALLKVVLTAEFLAFLVATKALLATLTEIKEIIDGFRPVSSGPEFIVKYADKKETKLNTNVLRRMVIQDDHKGKHPLPLQWSAEDAWANLSR